MDDLARYKWLSLKQHALERPDTYTGPLAVVDHDDICFAGDETGKLVASRWQATFSPGLLKFFDEVLVNAMDNRERDPSQRHIGIQIHASTGVFEVCNDGKTIPIEKWPGTDRYIAEVLFCELMTGENFDDAVQRRGGGRNGLGVKITNLFSARFECELVDQTTGLSYKQVYEHNMCTIHPPTIMPLTSAQKRSGKSSTTVRWLPEYPRIGMSAPPLDDATVKFLSMRAYDAAACTPANLTVTLNCNRIQLKTLKDFAAMMGDIYAREEVVDGTGCTLLEFCVVAPTATTIGFVNGIRCSHGTVVELIHRRVCEMLTSVLERKKKTAPTAARMRNFYAIVCKATIVNPSFASQTKDKLDTPVQALGFKLDALATQTARALERAPLMEALYSLGSAQDDKAIKKSVKATKSSNMHIDKYERSLKRGAKCSLYVTEGDSAKALAVEGFGVIGREYNGVYALRGKLINVSSLSPLQALEHREILHLTNILGLDPRKTYDAQSVAGLPYGQIVIFTDQDHDGSHIMGLIIKWLQTFYKSLLLTKPDYIKRFITPIVRARIDRDTRSFFTLHDYEAWLAGRQPTSVKYYKGLGSSTNAEAREYFSAVADHMRTIQYTGAASDDALEAWFHPARADARKLALLTMDPAANLDYGQPVVTIEDFCRLELIHYARADCTRSIPSALDGWKPAQRKVAFAMLDRREEVRVSQAAAAVAERTAYHHGEASMIQTIVNMAQRHTGTNNVALLKNIGQFGSRAAARTVHAAPRYITTMADPIAERLLPQEDRPVYERNLEDGKPVEPKMYVPVVATLLLNGSDGIGTGWNTYIPPFNPLDIIHETRRLIDGKPASDALVPHYHKFTGTIEAKGDCKFTVTGTFVREGNRLTITELPPRKWIDPYIEHIKKTLAGDTAKAFVLDIVRKSSGNRIDIVIDCKAGSLDGCDIVKTFDLMTLVDTRHMHAFDLTSQLQKYDTVAAIFEEHATARRDLYARRKAHVLQELERDATIAANRHRFVQAVIQQQIVLVSQKRTELRELLHRLNYNPHPTATDPFAYLCTMPMDAMTIDAAEELRKRHRKLRQQADAYRQLSVEDLWSNDLDRLEAEYMAYLEREQEEDEPTKVDMAPKKKPRVK